MDIKTPIEEQSAKLRDRLRRHTSGLRFKIGRRGERMHWRLRGASRALIGAGALLIALGFSLRNVDRRIADAPIFEHSP
jgi:hypothetical protein